MTEQTFGMRGEAAGRAGVASLHPDRNFDTIACLAREVGFEAALARLTMGARCAVLAGGAAEWLGGLLGDASRTAALGWDVRRTSFLDGAGRLQVEPLRAWLAQEPAADRAVLRVAVNEGAGPYLCRPLQMGADLVVEDVSLWADGRLLAAAGCGGGDGGGPCLAVIARSERTWSQWAASCPVDDLPAESLPAARAAVLESALGTLSLVSQRRSDTALVAAHYLAACPRATWVSYPGLADDPANGAARRTLEHGFGPRVAFGVVGEPACGDGLGAADRTGRAGCAGGCAASRIERVSPTTYVLHVGLESALDVVGWIDRFLKGAGGPVE